jgi:hypothetical protein
MVVSQPVLFAWETRLDDATVAILWDTYAQQEEKYRGFLSFSFKLTAMEAKEGDHFFLIFGTKYTPVREASSWRCVTQHPPHGKPV